MTSAVIRIVRVGTWATLCALALLGLIAAGSAVVLPVLVAPVVGGLVGWALARHRTAGHARTCAAIVVGAVMPSVGVLAVAGLVVLAGPGAVPAACALGAVLAWVHRCRAPRPVEPQAEGGGAALGGLSNVQLARAWQTSYRDLASARDPFTLGRICGLRRRQLDEIERRDPAGFHRWINSGHWVRGDSAPFLGS